MARVFFRILERVRYIVLGAGKQGTAIIHDLVHADGNSITIADRDRRSLELLAARFGDFRVQVQQVDLSDTARLSRLMESADVAISAVPYFFNLELARAAVEAGTHFCDLGGNTEIVYRELELGDRARRKGVHVIPDCGLSPGMTNILAAHVVDLLPRVDRLELRVGGLPKHPVPPLNYQLTFSVHGLLNEYIEPATIVRNGQPKDVESLSGIEPIHFDGFPPMEAFYTHGGISTLPKSLAQRVPNMDEKTIRYPGHASAMRAILKDSRFESRDGIAAYLEAELKGEDEDVVLLRVSAFGEGQVTCELVDHYDPDTKLSAMMRTTGFSASIVAQMMAEDRVGQPGAHLQEESIPTDVFIEELGRRNILVRDKVLPSPESTGK